tara:strand:- start:8355 stop:9209 length:855 start_codon:yes stop_codon:yes gene_type:complete
MSIFSDWWDTAFGKGDGPGAPDSVGGLSEQDRAFIDQLYTDYEALPDAYEKYTGNRYADISPEEQQVLEQLQAGGGYKELYDKAQTNLGLSGDVYKDQMNMTDADLMQQARGFRNPFESEMQGQIQRQLTQGLANANIANNASAFGSGAGGGSRQAYGMQPTQEALFRGAGDALSNLSYNTYTDSINQARQANRDRMSGASAYGNYVNQDLGLGVGGLDKDYGTKMSGFAQDRANQQQDLDFGYQEWQTEKMFPFMKLGFGANMIGALPLDQKQAVPQPASGGK